jgi:hypothetical protein
MPGVFSKEARPVRPGAYFDWAAEPTETILPSIGSVVLLGIVHDWGPAGSVVPTVSLGDFQSKFGSSTTPGYRAVKQAFKGEGLQGRGGAGEVLVYRLLGTGGKAAEVDVENTTATAALTLTAKYPGSFGNVIGYKNHADPDVTKNDFMVYVNGQFVETYAYPKTDIQDLVDQINATSAWVSATLGTDGTAIAVTVSPDTVTPLTGGDDGATLVQSDWQDLVTVCSSARFSLFAAFDLIDPTTLTSLQQWCQSSNLNGRRFMLVVGGALADTATTAIARSKTLEAASGGGGGENIVNVGVGTLVDNEFGTLSTSQLAPRIAGILAARGESMSLTFARLADTTAGVLPTDADVTACFNGGVVVFGQDSNQASPIRVEKGLTCYTGGDSSKPYLIYRNPKFVRTMHGIELDITEWSTSNAIGSLQVNDATRAYVVGYAHQVIQARSDRGVIQTGFSVGIDPIPPPSDDDEFIALVYGIAFGRSVEQIFNLVYIS